MSFGVDTLGLLIEKLKQLVNDTQDNYESFFDSTQLFKQGKMESNEYFSRMGEFLVSSSALNFLACRVILELKTALDKTGSTKGKGERSSTSPPSTSPSTFPSSYPSGSGNGGSGSGSGGGGFGVDGFISACGHAGSPSPSPSPSPAHRTRGIGAVARSFHMAPLVTHGSGSWPRSGWRNSRSPSPWAPRGRARRGSRCWHAWGTRPRGSCTS